MRRENPIQVTRRWHQRIPLIGPVALTRPRWSLAVVLGVLVYLLLAHLPAPLRLIVAWDLACLFFLVATTVMAIGETPEQVRHRARRQDQGAFVILLLTLIGVGACLVAIVSGAKELKQFAGGPALTALLVATTVITTWLVTHFTFALHYAHLFYGDSESDSEKPAGGLDFPGDATPDYFDFAYFALVLGMTFQVSDVSVTNRRLRRLVTLHGIVSFFFSTVILALAINMFADLAR